ncbi:MAG: hypothetical protein D6702_11970 [Planctomycetota bacterium]|nr:MAG: hypothetical protein D6702_11970 [Planctomycetota bacterium]
MPAALLLLACPQLPHLLPPLEPVPARPEQAAWSVFQEAAADGTLAAGEGDTLAALGGTSEPVLIHAWLAGSPTEHRLASLLAAGCAEDSPLALAALHGAWRIRDEGASLAALLAPASFPPAAWPVLAWLALDSERPLSVRAAACGRLLRAGCRGAWPVARSILRTGTALDEQAPWADWNRLGRYELPKRLLVLDLDALFAAAGEAPSGFEPNAAWSRQEEQLAALEPRIERLLAGRPPLADRGLARGVAVLLRADGPERERAWRAAALLAPHSLPILELALTKQDPVLVQAARRALELLPR